MGNVVGIDLGTTYSAVAVIDDTGRPKIVSNSDGKNITSSAVAEIDGNIVVGHQARKQGNLPGEQVAEKFKRDMDTQKPQMVNGREFTPTELSTFVLRKLVQDTQAKIGPIDEAVVTIPANFANEAREATLAAAKEAGLNVNFIINEPTAAALYYASKGEEGINGYNAVFDLGGGTFDISIIKVQGQDIDVIASNGVPKLGGDDFDKAIQEIVAGKYKAQAGEEMQPDDYKRLDAEDDKISLSSRSSARTRVVREAIEIKRAEFEEAISSFIAQMEMLCESTLEEAGLKPSDINKVLLAGGSTRIPIVRSTVERIFKQEPVATVNVDEVVALGAALYAAYKGDQEGLTTVQKNAVNKINVQEQTSKYFGTISLSHDTERDQAGLQNTIIIEKGAKIPCSESQSFYTVVDNQTKIDCKITESNTRESDPEFVKILRQGKMELPGGRPRGQEIKITYTYDDNQTMKCTFTDVATGTEKVFEITEGFSEKLETSSDIENFTVE